MSNWHYVGAIAFSLAVVAFGRLMVSKARKIADFIVDFEASSPTASKASSGERGRVLETHVNKAFGYCLIFVASMFALICAIKLMGRVLS